MSWGRRAAAGLLAVTGLAVAAAPGLLDFSADERARIAAHGPWPPARSADPGNALSGRPAAIALGERLFFDARLSRGGRLACASCHQPRHAFTDGRPRALGRAQADGPVDAPLDRNTPSLLDAAQHRWWGWDGAFDSLWSQALHPLRNPREMHADGEQILRPLALQGSDRADLLAFFRSLGSPLLPAPGGARSPCRN